MSERPIALVTGGATGIGAACARALDAEGFRVALHYRASEDAARELCAALSEPLLLRADLAKPEGAETLIAALKDETGRLDVLVNNAGVNHNAPLPSMKLEDYEAVTALMRGTWYLTKLAVRRFMLRQQGGRIINISSVVGHTGNPGQSAYTMVKAGLDALTKSLAQELGPRQIHVNSVAPGFIDTEMTRDLPEGVRSSILDRVPLARMGTADEIGDAVAWLATRADYVNGSVLHVNGGLYGG